MNLSLEELETQAMRLPAALRAILANRLAESLTAAELAEIDEEWNVEIKRRLDELHSGQVKTIPGDEVFAEVRRIIGG